MRRRSRQQPRRRPVSQIIGVEQDQITRVGRVELVDLEAAVECGKVPFQKVDKDLLAGGEHGAQRGVAGRILRPRVLVDHDMSLACGPRIRPSFPRSEEHTSELQSLMRISYAVFCLKKKKKK